MCMHMYVHLYTSDLHVYNSLITLKYRGLCFDLRIYPYNRFKVMLLLRSGSPHLNQLYSLPMWSQLSIHLYALGRL